MGEHCIYIGLWTGSMDVRLTLLNQNNNRWFKKVKRVRECQKLPSYCVTALGTAWNLWQIFKWVIGRKLCKLHLAQSLRLPGLRHNFQLTKIFFFHGQRPTLSLQPLARGITCRIIPTFWGKNEWWISELDHAHFGNHSNSSWVGGQRRNFQPIRKKYIWIGKFWICCNLEMFKMHLHENNFPG